MDGDLPPRRWGCSAVPMLPPPRKPDHVGGVDFLNQATPDLGPPAARRDDQGLTERMGVPCGARTGFERDAGAATTCRIERLEQRVNADRAGEIVRRPFTGRL